MVSPERRAEIIASLRRGTVPKRGLDAFAVGLGPFEVAVDEELEATARGNGVFKAIRGEYGTGKTFFIRWLQERARRRGFATAEAQVSETETPLHRLETVYRRLVERLSTDSARGGAFRGIVDAWFFALEEDVLAEGKILETDTATLMAATNELMEERLCGITRQAPSFGAALRGYRDAVRSKDPATAEGLIAWLAGQPNVAASIKRKAGIKGDIDHFGALGFLRGLLAILRDSGHPGLVLVLDEVETLQRVRRDVRDKGLNALRQWIDEVDAGRFPGLYLAITGTYAFFEGPQGVQRLPPLAQRLATDFSTEPRFDNPRAIQIRLSPFDLNKLEEVGRKVRDLFMRHCPESNRIATSVDDTLITQLARAVTGELGGKVGISPRVFLKKLVAEVLDRIEQFPDFDPRRHYRLTLVDSELSPAERQARAAADPDEIELDL